MLTIHWYGHAAFKLSSPELSVILDPYQYPAAGGYLPINDQADAVVVSHINDRYHSHTGQITPGFELLKAHEFPVGGVTFRGIHFQALPVYETPEKLAGDEVTVIYFTLGGLKIVFLSDLGHALTAEERAPLEDADLLLASTGGTPTIALDELEKLIDQLRPGWVVPMHYKTDKINLNILPNDVFLEQTQSKYPARIIQSPTITLDAANRPARTEVLVLDHSR